MSAEMNHHRRRCGQDRRSSPSGIAVDEVETRVENNGLGDAWNGLAPQRGCCRGKCRNSGNHVEIDARGVRP